eukprot:638911-Prorocentrum_minimum.AAC.5
MPRPLPPRPHARLQHPAGDKARPRQCALGRRRAGGVHRPRQQRHLPCHARDEPTKYAIRMRKNLRQDVPTPPHFNSELSALEYVNK